MEDVYITDLYEKFHCMADKCPTSCCKGWVLPVDDETYKKYEHLPGLVGRHIRFHISKIKGVRVIRRQFGRCPFLNSDKMCQFQAGGHPELMPLVCRTYPRETICFDKEARCTLVLSCPAVARLFIDNPGRRSFRKASSKVEVFWKMNNEDDAMFSFLKEEEEKLLDFFWKEEKEMPELWQAMYAYVYRKHDLIVRDRLSETKHIPLTLKKEDMGEYALLNPPSYSFFKIETIDHMVLDCINYGALSVREPKFYHLIKGYLDIFGQQYLNKVDDYFDEQMHLMLKECPEAYLRYKSYFSWCMNELFFQAFENYNIIRQYLYCILYTQL
ncbi:MAG: flagellin lysine-N-methylase, partial [Lachnospiraceae bacterium]|nr:flagellin lysine-N-methylase [Lachnospiraceae bacterium]